MTARRLSPAALALMADRRQRLAQARRGKRGLDLSRCGPSERLADAVALDRAEADRIAAIRRAAREAK